MQSNVSFVMLQKVVVVVKNPKDSKELKIKVLFDTRSQRLNISNRVANFLNFLPNLLKLYVSVHMEIINLFICMSLKNQPIKIAQKEIENPREINFADTGERYDLDLLISSDCYWSYFYGENIERKKQHLRNSPFATFA